MGFINKGSWIFLIVVIVVSIGIIGYVKEDSLFGLYSFDTNSFSFSPPPQDLDVFFCPEDNCASVLIQQIDSAQDSIYIAVYSFTKEDIADALIRAKERGVEVRIVFDYFQSESDYSVDERLIDNGLEIVRRKGGGSMHNKFCVIDEKKVLTGSFNYSKNADEKNDENLIFIVSESLAQEYLNEFNEIWAQAKSQEE